MFVLGFLGGLFFSFIILFFIFIVKEPLKNKAYEIKESLNKTNAEIIDTRDPLDEIIPQNNETIFE